MQSSDNIQRFIFENAEERGQHVHLSESFQIIAEQHNYPLELKKLLGQLLVVAALLSGTIKFKGRLTLQFQGKEPLKLILIQCNDIFELRGLIQFTQELSAEEILALLKNGTLGIIISPDESTQRYQGIVSWQGDSLAASIEGYFRDSEQIPTRIWLAADQDSAAGLLLQAMPSTHRETQMEHWEHLICLTETVTTDELLHLEVNTLLHRLYSAEDVRIFDPTPITFRCTCGIARSENAILMLGREEVEEELKLKPYITVTCEFCNKEYVFDSTDIDELFKKE